MLRLVCATAACWLSCAALAANLHHALDLRLPDGAAVENCADPTVLKGQRPGDPRWTMICTQDPLNEADRDDRGGGLGRQSVHGRADADRALAAKCARVVVYRRGTIAPAVVGWETRTVPSEYAQVVFTPSSTSA